MVHAAISTVDKESKLVKRCGIPFETLTDYRDGTADAETSARVREHLDADCAQCRENLAWLEATAVTLHEAQRVQVPQTALNRAHSLFRERFRAPERVSWLARLQFDSRRALPSLAGARGARPEGFQLIYSTDAHDIELFQEPTETGTWYIIGQVMPREGDETIVPQQVTFTANDGSELAIMPQSEEFHLPSVSAGLYQVSLLLTDGDIALTNVNIGTQEMA